MHGSVTAVVTTRNRLAMLRRTLGSVLGQEDAPLRVVVVDEGSTDGTQEFLAGVAHPRITVIRNDPPLGLPAARNAGIEQASTDWVAVCDDDDLWSPTKIRTQLQALAATDSARWAVAGTVLVDDTQTRVIGYRDLEPSDRPLAPMLERNLVPGVSGLMFERSLWDEVGRFDPTLRASEDWDFEIRLAERSPVAVARGAHVAYRVAAGSMSNDSTRMRESFDTLRLRYAALATANGVEFDAVGYEEYLARQEVTAGHGWAAAQLYSRLAWQRRNPRDVVRAAAAAVAPGWTDREGTRRAITQIPRAVLADAERWLASVPVLATVDGEPVPS